MESSNLVSSSSSSSESGNYIDITSNTAIRNLIPEIENVYNFCTINNYTFSILYVIPQNKFVFLLLFAGSTVKKEIKACTFTEFREKLIEWINGPMSC